MQASFGGNRRSQRRDHGDLPLEGSPAGAALPASTGELKPGRVFPSRQASIVETGYMAVMVSAITVRRRIVSREREITHSHDILDCRHRPLQ